MINLAATIAAMKEAGMADDAILVALSCVKAEEGKVPHRSSAAERQARYRARHSESVTRDVTRDVTDDRQTSVTRDVTNVTSDVTRDGGVLYNNKSKSSSSNNTPQRHLVTVLDAEHATAVIEHRQRLRKPLTSHAARLLAGKFAKCADPNAAADAMIANGWLGFEPEWMERQARVAQSKQPTLSAAFGQMARSMEPQDDPAHHPKPSGIVVLDVPFRPGR